MLVLAFAAAYLGLSAGSVDSLQEIREAELYTLQAERANTVRTALENNFDFIVKRTIEGEVALGNTNAETLKEKLCGRLFEFFRGVEESYGGELKVEFFEGSFPSGQYKKILLSKNRKKLRKEFLLENSRVLVVDAGRHVYFVEFSLTGGMLKSTIAYALMSGRESEQVFLIPVDYSQKVLVVR